jgi:uncharacterized pyridoxamine 5'-phosphate oxidase family protein
MKIRFSRFLYLFQITTVNKKIVIYTNNKKKKIYKQLTNKDDIISIGSIGI